MQTRTKTNLNKQQFKQTAGDRLEMQSGGGCIGCFGVPFFIAGIFMLLIVMHIVPLSNADEVPWWTYIVLFFMGLIFAAVGAGLIFGRHWVSIDTTQRRIWVAWGLLKPMKGTIYNLDDYKKVVLKFVHGDSDSADSYPVVLRTEEGGIDLSMCSSINYGDSREQANLLMNFLHLPLEDATTDHIDVVDPRKAKLQDSADITDPGAETEPEPQRKTWPESEPIIAPAVMRSDLQGTDESLQIRIPGPPFSKFQILGFIIPIGIVLWFGIPLLSFFNRTQTPLYVQYFFIGFAGLFFILLPLSGFLNRIRLSRKYLTIVKADKRGIVIEYVQTFRNRVITLPIDRIVDIDYSTPETAMNAAWRGGPPPGGRTLQPSQVTYTVGQKPQWIAWIERLSRSRGIMVKSLDGMYIFGAGLPNDEVYYLYTLTKSMLYPPSKED